MRGLPAGRGGRRLQIEPPNPRATGSGRQCAAETVTVGACEECCSEENLELPPCASGSTPCNDAYTECREACKAPPPYILKPQIGVECEEGAGGDCSVNFNFVDSTQRCMIDYPDDPSVDKPRRVDFAEADLSDEEKLLLRKALNKVGEMMPPNTSMRRKMKRLLRMLRDMPADGAPEAIRAVQHLQLKQVRRINGGRMGERIAFALDCGGGGGGGRRLQRSGDDNNDLGTGGSLVLVGGPCPAGCTPRRRSLLFASTGDDGGDGDIECPDHCTASL